jgi:hypothetical protein
MIAQGWGGAAGKAGTGSFLARPCPGAHQRLIHNDGNRRVQSPQNPGDIMNAIIRNKQNVLRGGVLRTATTTTTAIENSVLGVPPHCAAAAAAAAAAAL